MNPYQRGNRDGLLSLALEFDRLAGLSRDEADRKKADARLPGLPLHVIRSAEYLQQRALYRMQQWEEAARMARCGAEMLPEDPEEQP